MTADVCCHICYITVIQQLTVITGIYVNITVV